MNKSGARALMLLGHALLWAAAMLAGSYFLKGQPIADTLIIWMIAGYTIANGLLLSAMGGGKRKVMRK